MKEIQDQVGDYGIVFIDTEKTKKSIVDLNLKQKEELLKNIQNSIQ